jgi:phage-related holin
MINGITVIGTISKLGLVLSQTNWPVKIIMFGLAFCVPIRDFAHISIIFVFADLITGIWAAKSRKEKLTSKGIRATLGKLLSYLMIIMLVHLFERFIMETNYLHLVNIVTGIIVLAEFKSITENLECITGNKIFTKIYKTVFSIFNKKKEL